MKTYFNYGMAGKEYNEENDLWFGRSWGFWFPRITFNGGKFWKKEVTDISLQWLCFYVGITIYV